MLPEYSSRKSASSSASVDGRSRSDCIRGSVGHRGLRWALGASWRRSRPYRPGFAGSVRSTPGAPTTGRGGRTASQVLDAVTLEREDKITGPKPGRKGLSGRFTRMPEALLPQGFPGHSLRCKRRPIIPVIAHCGRGLETAHSHAMVALSVPPWILRSMATLRNREVENRAIAAVIAYELSQGRNARDARGQCAGDVLSDDRVIEVKAYSRSARGTQLWLEPDQYAHALDNPNFWIYVVDQIADGAPHVIPIGGDDLVTLAASASESTYYLAPLRVGDYDRLAPADTADERNSDAAPS